jgi:hypothetical protein
MPCPYNIILGRETALPCPLYHCGVTGIDITSGKRYLSVNYQAQNPLCSSYYQLANLHFHRRLLTLPPSQILC